MMGPFKIFKKFNLLGLQRISALTLDYFEFLLKESLFCGMVSYLLGANYDK